MNILYISDCVPYNKINHAGGKTLNYYVKRLLKETTFNVAVVGYCKKKELCKIKEDSVGDDRLKRYCVVTSGGFFVNSFRVIYDTFSKLLKLNKYEQSLYKTRKLLKTVQRLAKNNFCPDIIFLEWTNCVLLVNEIKNIFPNSKIIASEYDVSFLGLERKAKNSTGKDREKLFSYYEKYKKLEIDSLALCDYVLPESQKDKDLLIEEGIAESKIGILVPFYHDLRSIERNNIDNSILFWGAMYRPENYMACFWFINKVMPLLDDIDVRFVIAGNKPPKSLVACQNERVVVTGFVEDETALFANSLCFVSPLLTGAGIKVKNIEAISSGIPVLTNDIGIEGIPATDGKEYYHCTTPEDYSNIIHQLLNNFNRENANQMFGKEMIRNSFDLDHSFAEYLKLINRLSKEE